MEKMWISESDSRRFRSVSCGFAHLWTQANSLCYKEQDVD